MKKNILFVGLAGTLFIALAFFIGAIGDNACEQNMLCKMFFPLVDNDFVNSDIFQLIFLTLPILLLSLITYRMKDEVFHAWWGFAKWCVPVIIVATFLLENMSGGGTLGMNNDFTAFILIILYSIFVIVSFFKIVRAYIKTK